MDKFDIFFAAAVQGLMANPEVVYRQVTIVPENDKVCTEDKEIRIQVLNAAKIMAADMVAISNKMSTGVLADLVSEYKGEAL